MDSQQVEVGPAIAVVDDDREMRRAIGRLLEVQGMRAELFECAEAFPGGGAWDRFRCLVLDNRLPGISGIELHRRLAAAGQVLPTVLITAHEDRELRRYAVDRGLGYLIKPFPGEALLAAIERSTAPHRTPQSSHSSTHCSN